MPLVNEIQIDEPYRPELLDLYRLHRFIILNKRLTVLEFGCGWSSLIMAAALTKNSSRYNTEVADLRKTKKKCFSLIILCVGPRFFWRFLG